MSVNMEPFDRIVFSTAPYLRRILTETSKAGIVKYYIGIVILLGTIYSFNDFMTHNKLNGVTNSNASLADGNSETGIVEKKSNSLFSGLPERIQLKDSNISAHFTPRENGKSGCYTAGSVHPEPGMKYPCKCRPGFYGTSCSIPEIVMTSACRQNPETCLSLKARSKARRIIHFFNVHRELDHVEIQLGELADVVDVFVMGESNRTISGEPNELVFLPKMKNEGLFKEHQHKIIHVFISSNEFPDDVPGNGGGWISEGFFRNLMGEKGLTRIDGIEDDDIILMLNTDEYINKDVLMFLKFHDGFPQPIRINFLELEYGFFWRRILKDSAGKYAYFEGKKDPVACTIGMLRQVYDNHIMSLRREVIDPLDKTENAEFLKNLIAARKMEYSRDGKHNVSDNWVIGRLDTNIGGFHCSWCFRNPEGIREKWLADNKQELADWGPNQMRLDLNYIKNGVAKGNLFDLPERNLYLAKPDFEGDLNFAPDYVWKNKDKFSYLLYPNGSIPNESN